MSLVKDYINKFYVDKEKVFFFKYFMYDMFLCKEYEVMFLVLNIMIVKVLKKYYLFIKELEDNIKVMYEKDDKMFFFIYFDKYFYLFIVLIVDGDKFKEIKIVLVRLNKGERDFIDYFC